MKIIGHIVGRNIYDTTPMMDSISSINTFLSVSALYGTCKRFRKILLCMPYDTCKHLYNTLLINSMTICDLKTAERLLAQHGQHYTDSTLNLALNRLNCQDKDRANHIVRLASDITLIDAANMICSGNLLESYKVLINKYSPGGRQYAKYLKELLFSAIDYNRTQMMEYTMTVIDANYSNSIMLQRAVEKLNVNMTKLLLEHGANPTAKESKMLRESCSHFMYSIDIIKLLLKYGASPADKKFETIENALRINEKPIITVLLDHCNGKKNTMENLKWWWLGNKPIRYLLPYMSNGEIKDRLRECTTNTFRILADDDILEIISYSDVAMLKSFGKELLHCIFMLGDTQCIEALMSKYNALNDVYRESPIEYNLEKKNHERARKFISIGANRHNKYNADQAFTLAVRAGYYDLVGKIMRKNNVNKVLIAKTFKAAIKENDCDLIRTLINGGSKYHLEDPYAMRHAGCAVALILFEYGANVDLSPYRDSILTGARNK